MTPPRASDIAPRMLLGTSDAPAATAAAAHQAARRWRDLDSRPGAKAAARCPGDYRSSGAPSRMELDSGGWGCYLSAQAGATWAIVLRRTPAARPQRTSAARAPWLYLSGCVRTGAQPCVACGRAENSARPLFS